MATRIIRDTKNQTGGTMALTSEQREVFLLAMEKIEVFNTQAMDHASYSSVSSRKKPGMNAIIEWALDYMACLPDDKVLAMLVVRVHVGSEEKWDSMDARRCGGACRQFYRRIAKKRLFGAGMRFVGMSV